METQVIEVGRFMAQIDSEEARIADIFRETNWSNARSARFFVKKKHWWSRRRTTDYGVQTVVTVWFSKPCNDSACTTWHPTMWRLFDCCIRSDGKLFVAEDRSYIPIRKHLAELSDVDVLTVLGYLSQCTAPYGASITIHD